MARCKMIPWRILGPECINLLGSFCVGVIGLVEEDIILITGLYDVQGSDARLTILRLWHRSLIIFTRLSSCEASKTGPRDDAIIRLLDLCLFRRLDGIASFKPTSAEAGNQNVNG
jgi:hypothetical protein